MPAAAPVSMVPEVGRVLGVRRELRETVSLTIASPPHGAPIQPGQFNMLYAFAVGEAPISVSAQANAPHDVVHTIRAVGAVTAALCGLRKGDAVGIRGPFGQAWPLEALEGTDLLVIAGGLGLAPLRPVVHHVLAHRARYGDVSLLVGARTPEDLLYARELARWQRRSHLRVLTAVDRARAGWKGRIGVVTALLDEVAIDPSRAAALVCGPEVMMRFTVRELERRGVPDGRVFLSMERNMKCALGVCGHCQLGPEFICRDGPVLPFDRLRPWFFVREA